MLGWLCLLNARVCLPLREQNSHHSGKSGVRANWAGMSRQECPQMSTQFQANSRDECGWARRRMCPRGIEFVKIAAESSSSPGVAIRLVRSPCRVSSATAASRALNLRPQLRDCCGLRDREETALRRPCALLLLPRQLEQH